MILFVQRVKVAGPIPVARQSLTVRNLTKVSNRQGQCDRKLYVKLKRPASTRAKP